MLKIFRRHYWDVMTPMPALGRSDMTATVISTHEALLVGGCDDHQVSCEWWEGCSYCARAG